MKPPVFLTIFAVLFAAISLPTAAIAQSTNVKTPNKNQSAKFKSAIFKGSGNLIESNSIASFIGGGQSNIIFAGLTNCVIGGGFGNFIINQFATVGGGIGNTASGSRATVGGGDINTASGSEATVGGGKNNTASVSGSTVGGGEGNTASSFQATVGGGQTNTASKDAATVGGGNNNTASGFQATVGGGLRNTSSGQRATVGGGEGNTASGAWATVPGGARCKATNEGTFVWGGSLTVDTISTNNNSFTVRAPGGVRFISTLVDSTAIGPVLNGNNGVFLAPNSGAWASLSDSNAKTKVTAVKPREILSKVASMPVTEWEYKADPNRRYIGPMAQDFHAAFGLGRDDKSITTLDSDGVMYAAIKGLVEELKDRDRAIEELKAKNSELSRSIEAINERLNSLPPAP